jgi:flagellar L-ring protein precursor FlgH
MKLLSNIIILLLLSILLMGCSSGIITKAEPPWPTPTELTRSRDYPRPTSSRTSLWAPGASLTRAYDDHRARRIGDLVTVEVSESSEASKQSSTSLNSGSSVDLGISAMLGAPAHLGVTDIYAGGGDLDPTVAASSSKNFSGSGSTSRKESLTTSIAARVMEIMPDGNMLVEGRRQVEVNEEIQYLYVRGIARPVDISPENSIHSTALADAEIIYSGTGAISSEQKPGWGYRLFSAIWPF